MAGMRVYSWLMVAVIVSMTLVTVSEAGLRKGVSSVSSAATTGMIPFNVRAWLQQLRTRISKLKVAVKGSKRSCNGFPCMYTHLGAKAGRQAMMRSLMSIIHSCAHNPACSPGKRRRRSASASAVLAMLTPKNTSS